MASSSDPKEPEELDFEDEEENYESKIDKIFNTIRNIKLPEPGLWYQGRWEITMKYVMEQCKLLLEELQSIEKREKGIKMLNSYITEDQKLKLMKIYSYLYSILYHMGRYSLKKLPSSENVVFTPIYRIYIVISRIVCFLVERQYLIPEYINAPLSHIPYCIENGLIMANMNTPISVYSMSELVMSLKKIDAAFRCLPGNKALFNYIFALEVRASFFVVYAYNDKYHDMESYRVKAKNDEGIYACSDNAIFELAFTFLAFRRELESMQLKYRASNKIVVAEKEYQYVFKTLQSESERVFTQDTDEHVRNIYRSDIVSPRLVYEYIVQFPSTFTVNGEDVYGWKKNIAGWNEICNVSNLSLKKIFDPYIPSEDIHIDENMDEIEKDIRDPMIMRISIFYVLGILIKQDTRDLPHDIMIGQTTLATANERQMAALANDSVVFPKIVFSFNDAGVFWNKKIYIFGSTPSAFIKAVWAWVRIIVKHYKCTRTHPRRISYYALCNRLLGPFMKSTTTTTTTTTDSSSSSSSATSEMASWGNYFNLDS